MLKEGYSKKTEQDRINYGRQLRSAVEEFAEDFLPHMREEEEVCISVLHNACFLLIQCNYPPFCPFVPKTVP